MLPRNGTSATWISRSHRLSIHPITQNYAWSDFPHPIAPISANLANNAGTGWISTTPITNSQCTLTSSSTSYLGQATYSTDWGGSFGGYAYRYTFSLTASSTYTGLKNVTEQPIPPIIPTPRAGRRSGCGTSRPCFK